MKTQSYIQFLLSIIFFIGMFGRWSDSYAQSLDHNYVKTVTYLQATTKVSNAVKLEDVSYQDGFGREIQKVQIHATPDGQGDLITPVHYGVLGRKERDYFPYARIGNNGAYHTDAFSASNWSVYGNGEQSYTFTRIDYDNSPLDRVVKQTGPGASWHTERKGVSTSYIANVANQVVLWQVDEMGNLVNGGYYAANTLPCVQVKDEDGRVSEVFTDVYDGKKRMLLSVEVCGEDRYETYYVYDDYGNLAYVLSPEASSRLRVAGVSEDIIKRYAYRYHYDRWGRLIEKKLPGCEPLLMVYDNKDRMVLSQDGNQRTSNTWSYSLYDSKNRVIEIGEIGLGSKSHAQLQEEAGNSGNYIPSGTRTALQYSLYDTYTPTSIIVPHAFVASVSYATSYHPLVTGLLTATKTRILDTDSWQTTTLYYDDRVRVIQTVSDNRLGGISRCDMKYDFVDHLIQQRESHGKSSGQADVLESVNSYDNRGRLLSQSIRLNGGTAATVSCQYDAVGRLTGRKYGNLSETLSYNIRGWLTAKTSTPFRMSLRYESPQGGSAARYNGNISEWEWQQGTNATLMYGFTYDDLSRFSGAVEKQKSGTTWSTLSGHYTEQGLSYDRNGNLLGLQRTAGGAVVDHLAYSYTGNQLMGLTENVRTSPTNDIYAPGNAAVGSYSYDANGNLLNDSRRALNFDYNVLDLLSEVRSGSTLKATYTWLADGTKLGVRDGSGANGFEYLGSLIYRKSGSGFELSEALFGDGVIRLNDNGTQVVNYFLTDHLGSVRVIVDASGTVKERNDYYPFGARHVRSDYAQSTNRWKYSGKEEQTTGDLDYLDYGARMYDASLGRWMTMDPMAENRYSLSSYNYCVNNPLLFVDPDGAWDTHYIDEFNNMILQTDDGSDDIVRIPRDRMSEFLSVLKSSSWDAGRLNSLGWNNYWKSEFGLADIQFSKGALTVLDMFNTKWSRNAAAAYLLKPTLGNALKMGFSEGLSQWTNPELVAGNLGMILSMFKVSPQVSSAPRPYPVRPDVPGTKVSRTLYPGEMIDRYGKHTGQWASPVGTSYGARSIPDGLTPYTQYKVLKPIKVQQSLVAPGERAGQTGYGIQYKFSKPIEFYINNNYLEIIKSL